MKTTVSPVDVPVTLQRSRKGVTYMLTKLRARVTREEGQPMAEYAVVLAVTRVGAWALGVRRRRRRRTGASPGAHPDGGGASRYARGRHGSLSPRSREGVAYSADQAARAVRARRRTDEAGAPCRGGSDHGRHR